MDERIVCVFLHLVLGMWYCSRELSGLGERLGSDVAILEVGLHTDLQVYLQLRQTWVIFCKLPSQCAICSLAYVPVSTCKNVKLHFICNFLFLQNIQLIL